MNSRTHRLPVAIAWLILGIGVGIAVSVLGGQQHTKYAAGFVVLGLFGSTFQGLLAGSAAFRARRQTLRVLIAWSASIAPVLVLILHSLLRNPEKTLADAFCDFAVLCIPALLVTALLDWRFIAKE